MKLKTRFSVCGDMQKIGVDYFNTFAPIVQCTTMTPLLILSIQLISAQLRWTTTAFPQAKLEDEVSVEIP